MNETDVNELVPCPPWSNRVSKMAQPNLDFMGKYTKTKLKTKIRKAVICYAMHLKNNKFQQAYNMAK